MTGEGQWGGAIKGECELGKIMICPGHHDAKQSTPRPPPVIPADAGTHGCGEPGEIVLS